MHVDLINPHPSPLASMVIYQINERKERSQYYVLATINQKIPRELGS